jgi:hypothetical protein
MSVMPNGSVLDLTGSFIARSWSERLVSCFSIQALTSYANDAMRRNQKESTYNIQ